MPGMNPNHKNLLLQLAAIILAIVIALGLQAREQAMTSEDLYGYAVAESADGASCVFDYVQLGAAGRQVALARGHARAEAEDGSDFSNDCGLPSRADNPVATQNRIHDDHDDSRAAHATIGLQGFDGRTAREARCNKAMRVASRQAVCFFDPRSTPGKG